MPTILTVRIDNDMLAKLDRKASALGRNRAEHVRQVLAEDIADTPPKPKRFVCLNLLGSLAVGHGSNNAAARKALAKRA